MTKTQLENTFGPYRRPTEITIPKFEAIQKKTLELATLINDLAPESREKSLALTTLQDSRMWANAAIAIHTSPDNQAELPLGRGPDSLPS